MEIGQIIAFERVTREGSFTRAAQSLDLTQPAVSTRINLLESELGGPLFERRGRDLKLTLLGEHFLPYARRILAAYDDGEQAVRDFHHGRVGQIKLAAPTPFLLGMLVETLAHFRTQHPTIDVLIRERNKTVITELIHDGAITLGLVNAPVYDRDMLIIARFRDPIRLVVPAGHTLARYGDQPVPLTALYRYTVFRVSIFPQMTAFVDAVAEEGRVGSGGAVIAVPMVMALRLVKLGRGITFLPQTYVQAAINAGEVVTLHVAEMPALHAQPVLITHKDRPLDDAHHALVRLLRKDWAHLVTT